MHSEYQPKVIEPEIQKMWQDTNCFVAKEDPTKEKFYSLSMLPYPSGQIHMGHVRNYMLGDVIARYHRMQGKNVLQPMGWDAFGLPAENAALKHGKAPSKWTYQNIADMKKTLETMGFGFDWSREIATCKPEYYRWEQWLFLKMYERGLVYKKKSIVNFDPVDQTVLANEQVVDGRGWRSGALVERREISQWFFKITDYAEELLDYLDKMPGWPERVLTMQRNWIGKSQGLEITFTLAHNGEEIKVFTTRPDTLMGVTYMAIAPNHPLVDEAAKNNPELAAFQKECQNIKVSEAELATMEKKGIDTGLKAKHPITGELVPIFAANFVLLEYGSGVVMAVPAHDSRDFAFAQKYNLPIKKVIKPKDGSEWDYSKDAFTEHGILYNSGEFDGLDFTGAFNAIADYLGHQGRAEKQTNYRLRDWGVSRQRYWGTPIPIIYCAKCGDVLVPEQDLPVVLPENLELKTPQSPLKTLDSFVNTVCPKCGGKAKRETDTFDTFVESSWYYARYLCPDQDKAMLDERANYWLPVDQYIGGIEHATMHLLYSRFIHKVMRDIGLVNCDEPFTNLLTLGMVLKDGTKMSKSKGNVVEPAEIIKQYSVDTARLFSMFAAPPENALDWSESGVDGSYRFLRKLWNFAYEHQEMLQNSHAQKIVLSELTTAARNIYREIETLLEQASNDMQRKQFNTIVSAAMKMLNLLHESVKDSNNNAITAAGFKIMLIILHPIVPHITQKLWLDLSFPDDLMTTKWPEVNSEALKAASYEIVIQVNGKLRGKIEVASNASKEEIEKMALEIENVKRHTDGLQIVKTILVPNKLINLIVK